MVPWKNGKPLIWNATCPDTLTQSYRAHAIGSTGMVAEMAEEKLLKYSCFSPSHTIVHVAIKTLGAIGLLPWPFLKDL